LFGRDIELSGACGAPVRKLPLAAVLKVRARAVWTAVPDLAAGRGLDAVDPPGAEDDAVVAYHGQVAGHDVPAVRHSGVIDIADAQLVRVNGRAMRRGGQTQQAPGAERWHIN
jgi:hypothetical protein